VLRDPIQAEEFRDFASIDGAQCIEPMDARDNISGFKLVKSACRYHEFGIPESLRDRDARLMDIAQGQPEY
jgi:hypothetical protein